MSDDNRQNEMDKCHCLNLATSIKIKDDGGNYILTKELILEAAKEFYQWVKEKE